MCFPLFWCKFFYSFAQLPSEDSSQFSFYDDHYAESFITYIESSKAKSFQGNFQGNFTQMDSFIQNRSQWYVLFQSNFWTQWALIKAIKRSYHSEKSFYILELNSSKLPTIQEIRTEILTTIMDALEVNFLESFVSVQIIGQRVFANCVKQVEFQVLRSVISRLNSGIFRSFDLIK